jgi:hypothetical protein
MQVRELFNFARKYCGFCDVLEALGCGGVAAAEKAAVVGGDVIARDFSFADEYAREAGGAAAF